MSIPVRPLPRPSAITQPFWDGARARELRIQKCDACGGVQHPARPSCKHCWSDRLQWIKCSGHGVIYTYSICHWATIPAFKARTPYAVGLIDLDEGVRLSTAINSPLDQVKIGAAVRAVFEDVEERGTLVNFEVTDGNVTSHPR